MIIPDVLGYLVEEAVDILINTGYTPVIQESYGKRIIEAGVKRVLRQTVKDNGEIELVISLF